MRTPAFVSISPMNWTSPSQMSWLCALTTSSSQAAWYSGSGIYRHVRVVVTEPIHVAPWGVFVTTPGVEGASAKILIHTQLQNESAAAAERR